MRRSGKVRRSLEKEVSGGIREAGGGGHHHIGGCKLAVMPSARRLHGAPRPLQPSLDPRDPDFLFQTSSFF